MESQKAVSAIGVGFNVWKDNPTSLTQDSFWLFLEGLGKRRKVIAQKCKAEDIEIFGNMRHHRAIFTDLYSYTIMRDFAVKTACGESVAHSSPDEQLQTFQYMQSAVIGTRTKEIRTFFQEKNWSDNVFQFIYEKFPYQREHFPQNKGFTIYRSHLPDLEAELRSFYMSKFLYEGDTYLTCNHQTHGSAAKDSPAISELYNLFKDLVSSPSPEFAFAFFHKFAITMPYYRGSSAVNEWILAAASHTMGIPMPQQSVFAEFDQTAQISTRDEFIAFMMAKIA